MPAAIALTVKNGANVDKTFSLDSPAAGDGAFAAWSLKDGAVVAAFPQFTAGSTKTPRGRQLKTKLYIPVSYVDTSTSQTVVTGERFEVNVVVSVPDAVPVAIRDDCAAFAVNLLGTTLIKSMIRDGLPAT